MLNINEQADTMEVDNNAATQYNVTKSTAEKVNAEARDIRNILDRSFVDTQLI